MFAKYSGMTLGDFIARKSTCRSSDLNTMHQNNPVLKPVIIENIFIVFTFVVSAFNTAYAETPAKEVWVHDPNRGGPYASAAITCATIPKYTSTHPSGTWINADLSDVILQASGDRAVCRYSGLAGDERSSHPYSSNIYGAIARYYCGSYIDIQSPSPGNPKYPGWSWTRFICPDPKPQLNPKGAPSPSCPSTANPISIGYGNKFLHDVDYITKSTLPLMFKRTYNSTSAVYQANQGVNWRNSFNYNTQTINNRTFSYRPDGKVITFNAKANASWFSDPDITDKLTEIRNGNGVRVGWTYQEDATGFLEIYNAKGLPIKIKDRAGLELSLQYSCKKVGAECAAVTPDTVAVNEDMLIQVTDHVGRSLYFTYDKMNRISMMRNPQGGIYAFGYDSEHNLAYITYPDHTIKTYLYEDIDFKNALTGMVDENGSRYSTYRYDDSGRAYDEELAQELDLPANQKVEHNHLSYEMDSSGNPISTTVTDSRGSQRTYQFTTILGVVKSTGQSQPGGAGCSASSSKITYDANGNVASRTDFDDHKTLYQYDLNRNLETSRTEGLTSAGLTTDATRTITTTWHNTWSLPLVISEYSGAASAGVPLKITTHTYDDRGNLTSFTESDPALNLNRTTAISYTYSAAIPGLVVSKVVDGPRTDVNDISIYTYYPHDAVCTPSSAAPIVDPVTGLSPHNLGCRGQLKSVKNALNQITTYNRYNHHGQVEQVTDANGLVTTMTYDLRQRLTSRTVGTEATVLTYDNAGQVIQLQMPDSSALNYVYDAAHRLIEVQDSQGNKVLYTLDAEGNRIKEETQDPAGNLTKTLTRSYDALNRLQAVTGVE